MPLLSSVQFSKNRFRFS